MHTRYSQIISISRIWCVTKWQSLNSYGNRDDAIIAGHYILGHLQNTKYLRLPIYYTAEWSKYVSDMPRTIGTKACHLYE